MKGTLTIQQAGNSVVTDLGRFRGPHFGLPVNGALDQQSARIANVLAGNPDGAPLIEVTALDIRFTTDADTLIAVTGAPATLTVGGRPRAQWEPISVRAGESVSVRSIRQGLRTYIAFHGSLDAPLLLGSCAPDTVVGFGLKLHDGARLGLRATCPPIRHPYFDLPLFRLGLQRPDFGPDLVIEATEGPDVEEFGDSAALIYGSSYTVSGRSNHIGLRLGGTLPRRTTDRELLSRGLPVGAVEVPNQEELLVLHRGRGVTAGYPVLAVVTSTSLDVLAQARPGDRVTFRKTTVEAATASYQDALRRIDELRRTVSSVFNLLGIGGPAHWQDLEPAIGL